MKLLSITLENIRSYLHEKVEFRNGISLFEGDIGSGKSSILNAIEFALFGLGDLTGSHLIRVGENEAKVELDIEINDQPYTLGRTLKRRRNNVRQDLCYIIEKDVKTDYNVTDMKKRVLQLLDFKEPPNPRSHSVIYRYAIFTPQEAMKAVLGQKPSDRKQTLRKAFGIEEYNTASENSTHLESKIEIDMRVLKKSEEEISGIVFKIEEETSQITDLEKNIEINNENIIKLEETQKEVNKLVLAKQEKVQKYRGIKSQIEIQKNQKALQEPMLEEAKERLLEINLNLKKCEEAKKKSKKLFSKYKELIENRIKRRKLEPEKEAYDQAIRQIELEEQIIETEGKNIQEKLENLQDNKENLKKQIQSFQLELQSLSELEDEVTQLESVVQGLPRFRDTLSDITSQISSQMQYIQNLQTKRDDLAREWRQIEKIGIGAECPRCQQQLTPMHYKLLEKKYVQDVNNVEKEIKKLNSKKKEAAKELENISNKIKVFEDKQKKIQSMRISIQILKSKKRALVDKKTEFSNFENEISELQKKLKVKDFAQQNREKIQDLQEQASKLESASIEFRSLKDTIEKLEDEDVEKKYLVNKSLADRKLELEKERKLVVGEYEKLEKALYGVEAELTKLNNELDKYGTPEEELTEVYNKYTEISSQISRCNALVEQNQIRINMSRGRIQVHKSDLGRHQKNIEQLKEFGLIRKWLEEMFIPSIHSIEQNVLRRLHIEFNRLFKKWFKTLLESGDVEGYINEEFTPIIDQSGYELEIESLSGGEKTSVALAYRLALNTIVKQVTKTMKSNLLILDEPTDGFSREQLYKMRDILHELNCEQVIMVSHERELESVADHIYHIHKEGSVSSVTEP